MYDFTGTRAGHALVGSDSTTIAHTHVGPCDRRRLPSSLVTILRIPVVNFLFVADSSCYGRHGPQLQSLEYVNICRIRSHVKGVLQQFCGRGEFALG